jgi:hypothetical protein
MFKELKGLDSEPQYDKDSNVVLIKTNFSDFSKDINKNVRKNHVFKLLERICMDINNGKEVNPLFYLSLYRKYQYRFLGNLFLASHIAPVIVIFLSQFSLENLFDVLLSLQFIWYVLIIIIQRYISKNYYLFNEIYYCIWYNKLLNFDILSVNALKEKLFNESNFLTSSEINRIVSEMQNINITNIEKLASSNDKLSSVLEKLTSDLQKYDLVTAESIFYSLEEKINRFEILCEQLESSASLSKESYKYLTKIVETVKIDINAINMLANEFYNMRNTIANYTNTAETAAIEKLSGITSVLENNISKAFLAIEETIKANTIELSQSYDRFFELCKIIIENQEKKNW